eukprot:SAG31_NODE_615_length_13521_cov_43.196916_9_plen_149_part_00
MARRSRGGGCWTVPSFFKTNRNLEFDARVYIHVSVYSCGLGRALAKFKFRSVVCYRSGSARALRHRRVHVCTCSHQVPEQPYFKKRYQYRYSNTLRTVRACSPESDLPDQALNLSGYRPVVNLVLSTRPLQPCDYRSVGSAKFSRASY